MPTVRPMQESRERRHRLEHVRPPNFNHTSPGAEISSVVLCAGGDCVRVQSYAALESA